MVIGEPDFAPLDNEITNLKEVSIVETLLAYISEQFMLNSF